MAMSSSSENTTDMTGPITKMPRPLNHQDRLTERRQQLLQQKQTDMLPSLPADAGASQTAQHRTISRQLIALRKENMHLRAQLAEIQAELDALHSDRHREIEHVRERYQDTAAEREALQDAYLQLEQNYNDLYNNFQSAVEEEAFRMVTEATHTLELSYDEPVSPPNDVKRTVELYVRQAEDRETAHTLYLSRQAERKAARLEEELELERRQLQQELERLFALQKSVREQAELRRETIETHLRAKFSIRFALAASSLLVVLFLLQIVFLTAFHIQVGSLIIFALIAPILLGIIAAGLIAHFRSVWRDISALTPHKQHTAKHA
jgi:hypothetical protein